MAKKNSKELARTEPKKPLTPFAEIEKRFEDLFRRPFSLSYPSWWPAMRMAEMELPSPTVDIFEEGGSVVIKAELPGMKKDEIHVDLTGDRVTISGEKKKEETVERKDYHHVERSYGSFTRALSLPCEVQTEKARAQFKDGVLVLRVPKTEEARQKKKKVVIE